jgi:hypothetical protein
VRFIRSRISVASTSWSINYITKRLGQSSSGSAMWVGLPLYLLKIIPKWMVVSVAKGF